MALLWVLRGTLELTGTKFGCCAGALCNAIYAATKRGFERSRFWVGKEKASER
jgi:hypothetical protein